MTVYQFMRIVDKKENEISKYNIIDNDTGMWSYLRPEHVKNRNLFDAGDKYILKFWIKGKEMFLDVCDKKRFNL